MKSRRMRVVIALIVGAVMLAGCGSSGGSKAHVSVPKGDPIVLGFICSCTGAQSSTTGQASVIIKAWADSVNDGGGLNGYPIKLIVKDDGGTPAKALQAAKQLVEEDKVVALVGNVTAADESFQSYLEDKQVPVVGGIATEVPYMVSPVFFTEGTTVAALLLGQFNLTKDAGLKKTGAFYCAESPICAKLVPLGELSAQLTGTEFTSAKASGSAANYTAPCLSMKDQGVDALFLALNNAVMPRVLASCANVGYHPTMVSPLNSFGHSFYKDPNFEGSLWSSTNANFLDTSIPGIKSMTEALEKYAPEVLKSDQYTEVAASAFFGGRLFEAASKAAGGFTPTTTSAEIMDGLYKLKDETLDGIAPPLNFVKGKPGFPTCYFTAKLTGGKLVSGADGKATCLPEEQVTALVKALSAAG